MQQRYEFFLASSLEKVFPNRRPAAMQSGQILSAWPGTRACVQLVYIDHQGTSGMPFQRFSLEITGAPCKASVESVELVPSDFPCYENNDPGYITRAPGLFPDLLVPSATPEILPLAHQYRSIWLSWDIPDQTEPGEYSVVVSLRAHEKEAVPNGTVFTDPQVQDLTCRCRFTLRVSKNSLLPQTLIHTEWFHTDCIAQYYHVPVFSEDYWKITEQFIAAAGERHGINMLLTPVFTPPLDTALHAERMTVQLVDVALFDRQYSFSFEKLHRWADLCRRHGIRYLEIPHLFTQWGAQATPKIIASTPSGPRQIFGWNTPANSPEYRAFLGAFLPALQAELCRLGYDRDHVYYHISDEPSKKDFSAYQTAKEIADEFLRGCHVIDALSDFDFYRHGLTPVPVCSSNHLQTFFDAGLPELWVYYCCAQHETVPNRFFALESARNRIMGVLMYIYKIQGFLHWGYNFYNAKFSLRPIDPYRNTHADYGFPSGDPFLVYPGPNGTVYSSVRAEVQNEALVDLRALQRLETLTSREYVLALIHRLAGQELTFTSYPDSADFLLDLRERVADAIDEHC